MTIRLSDQVGLDKVSKFQKLGIYDNFPLLISSSLGSLESSLLKITAGYASIVNGGYKVEPRMIDVIYDKSEKLSSMEIKENVLNVILKPMITHLLANMIYQKLRITLKEFSEESAYQMTSFLMGVIKRGTAKNINNFEYQVAGKNWNN